MCVRWPSLYLPNTSACMNAQKGVVDEEGRLVLFHPHCARRQVVVPTSSGNNQAGKQNLLPTA